MMENYSIENYRQKYEWRVDVTRVNNEFECFCCFAFDENEIRENLSKNPDVSEVGEISKTGVIEVYNGDKFAFSLWQIAKGEFSMNLKGHHYYGLIFPSPSHAIRYHWNRRPNKMIVENMNTVIEHLKNCEWRDVTDTPQNNKSFNSSTDMFPCNSPSNLDGHCDYLFGTNAVRALGIEGLIYTTLVWGHFSDNDMADITVEEMVEYLEWIRDNYALAKKYAKKCKKEKFQLTWCKFIESL